MRDAHISVTHQSAPIRLPADTKSYSLSTSLTRRSSNQLTEQSRFNVHPSLCSDIMDHPTFRLRSRPGKTASKLSASSVERHWLV